MSEERSTVTTHRVAVVIPVLNEAANIAQVLADMAAQVPEAVVEILVVDGGSRDDTRAIVARCAADDLRIRLIDNPKRLQSAAMNLAAELADPVADLLVRADAHARYPSEFLADLLEAADRSGAQSVVNRMQSVGTSCFQRAVAAVSNSRFGTGGAVHRVGGREGFVDHGHHALFDRAWFRKVGGYDESFMANEDAEFDVRMRAAGGRIWFTTGAMIDYFPRRTLPALARQYFRYGRGRASTRRKHGEPMRLRQLIPPFATVSIFGAAILSSLWGPLIAIPFLYVAGVAAAAAWLAWRNRDLCVLGALAALPAMHFSWGTGFLVEFLAGSLVGWERTRYS